MAKFLIEVPHSDDPLECLRVLKVFLSTGSHFLSNADWGCMDGIHKAWIVVDVENKDEARRIVPPAFRAQAGVVALHKFTLDEVENLIRQHGG